MDTYTCECYVECVEEVMPNACNWKIIFLVPVVSAAEWPWRRRLLYQDTTATSKVMEEGSITLFCRFMSKKLMPVLPSARGARTFSSAGILEGLIF